MSEDHDSERRLEVTVKIFVGRLGSWGMDTSLYIHPSRQKKRQTSRELQDSRCTERGNHQVDRSLEKIENGHAGVS